MKAKNSTNTNAASTNGSARPNSGKTASRRRITDRKGVEDPRQKPTLSEAAVSNAIADINRIGASNMAIAIIDACDELIKMMEFKFEHGVFDDKQYHYNLGFRDAVKAIRSFTEFKEYSQSPYDIDLVKFHIECIREGEYDESVVMYFFRPPGDES